VPGSTLAFLSTLHLAVLLLIEHRSAKGGRARALLLPSFFLVASPWILTSPLLIAAAFGAHVAWLVACEKLAGKAEGTAKPVPKPSRPVEKAVEPAALPVPRTAPTPSRDFQTVPVFSVLDETPDIKTFRLARPEGFEFQAGQFLMVRLPVAGQKLVRCYSISSAPEAKGYLEISVKRQGVASRTLHATVRPGSLLSIKGPGGGFVYPEEESRPLVLLGAGVGITPLASMLRHAVLSEPARPVTLLYSVKDDASIAFGDEFRLLTHRHPQVKVAVTVTGATRLAEGFVGRIDRRLVERFVPEPADSLYYVCGPIPMIEAMKGLLAGIGVPSDQVRSEAFEAAVAASRGPLAPARVDREATRPSRRETDMIVDFEKSGKRTRIAPGETLLEAAETAGAEIPSLCRAGACGTCKTRLLRGDVEFESDVLAPGERGEGYIFPCVAQARSSCALEA
jgi:ferredoxin-NADP reductase